MLGFVEGGKPENSEKNPRSKERTNNKLDPHVTAGPGIKPGPQWREARALTTAPSLLRIEQEEITQNTRTKDKKRHRHQIRFF